jgi:hypothetical protein
MSWLRPGNRFEQSVLCELHHQNMSRLPRAYTTKGYLLPALWLFCWSGSTGQRRTAATRTNTQAVYAITGWHNWAAAQTISFIARRHNWTTARTISFISRWHNRTAARTTAIISRDRRYHPGHTNPPTHATPAIRDGRTTVGSLRFTRRYAICRYAATVHY